MNLCYPLSCKGYRQSSSRKSRRETRTIRSGVADAAAGAGALVAGSWAPVDETAATRVGADAFDEVDVIAAKRVAGTVQAAAGWYLELAEHAAAAVLADVRSVGHAEADRSAVRSANLVNWPLERTVETGWAGRTVGNDSAEPHRFAAAPCAAVVSSAAATLALAFAVAAAAVAAAA